MRQHCKNTEIKEGDMNTRYFHAKANGRRRKNHIISLDQEEGKIEGEQELKKYITDYYKNLFCKPDIANVRLDIDNANRISQEEADELVKPFSMEEIKKAVFQMEHNKSPGPDGFTAEFDQHFWELVKIDLHAMLNDFHDGNLNIARLKYGIITLVPKYKDAKQIQKFRPICLLNVVFKFFTKS